MHFDIPQRALRVLCGIFLVSKWLVFLLREMCPLRFPRIEELGQEFVWHFYFSIPVSRSMVRKGWSAMDVPSGWVQVLRGPRPPSQKWPPAKRNAVTESRGQRQGAPTISTSREWTWPSPVTGGRYSTSTGACCTIGGSRPDSWMWRIQLCHLSEKL